MDEVNIVVVNDHFDAELCDRLFGPLNEWAGEFIRMISPSDQLTVLDLLVMMDVFPSKGQARKNWKGPVEIPDGFSDFLGLGKHRRRLTIWKPVETTE